MNKIPIVLCGAHFSTAFGLIEELSSKGKYQIYYIGRKNALEGDKSLSLEYKTANKLDISYFWITTGRLQRVFSPYTLLSFIKLPIGFIQSFFYLHKIKPAIVIAFGGYVALPVSIASWILGIPVIIHEQTPVLGLTNRIISKFAQKICLSWPETKGVPKDAKVIVTGNLVRKGVFIPKNSGITNFGNKNLPLLYVTGGSLGSQTINRSFGGIIPSLVCKYRIIHQCGSSQREIDYKMLVNVKNALPFANKRNYKVIKHIPFDNIGDVLQNTSLVVGRSGANTVSELAYWGKPAILIPLPWSASGEQEQNAVKLKNAGLAEIIRQDELTGTLLEETIHRMSQNLKKYEMNKDKAREIFHLQGTEKMVALVESL